MCYCIVLQLHFRQKDDEDVCFVCSPERHQHLTNNKNLIITTFPIKVMTCLLVIYTFEGGSCSDESFIIYSVCLQELLVCKRWKYILLICGLDLTSVSKCLLRPLTIFLHSTVLLALALAVELVAVGLAEALFIGHTQAGRGVKGPDGRLPRAGLGHHRQTTHGCKNGVSVHQYRTAFDFSVSIGQHPYPQFGISADTLSRFRSCSGCPGSPHTWRVHTSSRKSYRSNVASIQNTVPCRVLLCRPLQRDEERRRIFSIDIQWKIHPGIFIHMSELGEQISYRCCWKVVCHHQNPPHLQ